MRLLSATSVAHSFEYKLFEDISLELNSHESIAIIGVSGSGKSTLLHILSSFLRPDSGEVSILNRDIYALNSCELVDLRRNTLANIFQAHYLFKGFSADENLDVSSILASKPIDNRLLEALSISTIISQKVSELSGGQQQRVSIARALIKQPAIIFADEPTGNLDSATASDVMSVLHDYIDLNEAGMILVTHDEVLASRCDRVYTLAEHRLVQI